MPMPVFGVYENADTTEGRGPMILVALFMNKAAALAIAKGRGVMGFGDGEVNELLVYKTREEFVAGQLEVDRAKALAKLTPHEQKILRIG